VLLVSGFLLFAILRVVFAVGGSLTSVLHPVRRDMSAVWKNNTPAMGALVMAATPGGVLPVCPVLALLAGLCGLSLLRAADLVNGRKERLVATLHEKWT